MRILVVHSYYRLRGGEDVVCDAEADLLEHFGHQVFRHSQLNDDLSASSRLSNAKASIWNKAASDQIVDLIHRHRIEVVHFHNTFPSISPAPIRAAHRAGAATVQTLHNARQLCPKAVCFRDGHPCNACVDRRFALPAIRHACFHDSRLATTVVAIQNLVHRVSKTYDDFLDVAIAPTHFARLRFEQSGYPIAKIKVKPHFVETQAEVGDGRGGYALFVGRLSEEKGLPVLLDAWQKLDHPMPLKIIGTGPLAPKFDAQKPDAPKIDLPNGQEQPEWLGELSQEEVYDHIGDASVLILPSHCAESFGRVVVEAYAKGTPVIVANQGGQAQLVHEGIGRLFQSGNPVDLARAVGEIVSDPGRLALMRQTARQEYERHYTAERNHNLLLDIYEDALRTRGIAIAPRPPITTGPHTPRLASSDPKVTG